MLTIKVHVSPGADIEQTFNEATTLAKKLGCYVKFDFNGVNCCAHPDGDGKHGADRYAEEITKKVDFKYAMNR